ncbi:MAG: aminotransferase [Pirellulaceae bacterium]|nr:MAG: aminotransferase [Pirellulaceae bacterium]
MDKDVKSCFSQRARWAAGQPISELMAQALANPELISLAAGFVDSSTLPCDEVRRAVEKLMADPHQARAALQYGTTHGDRKLRELILAQWQAADGNLARTDVDLEQVILTAGSNQLLHLLADTLLDPGDIVLTARPTYLVFLGIVRNVGARAIGVPTDEDGPIPEGVEQTLKELEQSGWLPRVKALYLVPYFNNPCGATVPQQRRVALLDVLARWSRHHPIYLIADNAYRELRYEGPDIASMSCFDQEGDRVIETGTFSKSFSPGVRVGWGILPSALVRPVLDQKGNVDFGSPHFAQKLMAQVLQDGGYQRHVKMLQATYQEKLHAMLQAAEQHLGKLPNIKWRHPRGGLYLWVELPEQVDTGPGGRLLQEALLEGVLYVPGQYCFPADQRPEGTNTMRLSFGVQSIDGIQSGMAKLARAISRTLAACSTPSRGQEPSRLASARLAPQ